MRETPTPPNLTMNRPCKQTVTGFKLFQTNQQLQSASPSTCRSTFYLVGPRASSRRDHMLVQNKSHKLEIIINQLMFGLYETFQSKKKKNLKSPIKNMRRILIPALGTQRQVDP